jgi:hypothetical protein
MSIDYSALQDLFVTVSYIYLYIQPNWTSTSLQRYHIEGFHTTPTTSHTTNMSDGLNPTGPAQPTLNQVYATQGNQATKEPAEKEQASDNAAAAKNAPV